MILLTMTIIIIIRLLVVMVQQQPDNGAATQTKMSVLVNLRPLNPNAKQIKLPSIFA
jgi:hypothetical protein